MGFTVKKAEFCILSKLLYMLYSYTVAYSRRTNVL